VTAKSLPPRPSLDSLRKQAKKLARERALTRRAAQLVLAREYGFAGWQDLVTEVSKRVGGDVEWAAAQARRVIHDNDVARLKELVAEYPALLSWHADQDDGGLLGMATGAYGDAFDPQREKSFTRPACAELLIDAGAVVTPAACDGLIRDRPRGVLQLFERKGVLPRTLRFRAALGDLDAVRVSLQEDGHGLAAVNDAFMIACRFEHEAVAMLLLERAIALDPELGRQIAATTDRRSFIEFFIAERALAFVDAAPSGPWQAFVMEQVMRAVQDGDVGAFVGGLQREPWLLGAAHVGFQIGVIERATLRDRGAFINTLLDLDPAILRRRPPPPSQAIEIACTYAKLHLMPQLTRIWPWPDDLPHAAAIGNLARVRQWFDSSGAPALGDLERHYPRTSPHLRQHDDLHWGAPTAQHVLDAALAWSVINRHFDVADFLLAHGADINTTWNSHEPASILHHLVFEENYESMQFLIDRGIDMTIRDYRWHADATGWARYGKNDEKMATWLEEAGRKRGGTGGMGKG
jgi:hypothetical protein